jgi:hypothetical protein
MANFSPEHDSEILDICTGYLSRRDQVFLAVMELFIAKPSILKSRPIIMRTILTATDLSWVQQNALVKLVGLLDEFDFKAECPRYVGLVLDLTISAALSPQTVVAQTARTSLSQFARVLHGEAIVSRLFKADWLNPKTIDSIILLLIAIVHELNFSVFRPLVPLIAEALLAFPEHQFVPSGLRFLERFPPMKPDLPELTDLCLSRIQQLYWSFTHKRLLPQHPVDFQALGPIFGSITTDITSSDVLWTGTILEPLRYCVAYFFTRPNAPHLPTVFHPLVPLCPEQAVRSLGKPGLDVRPAEILSVIEQTRNTSVLARCIDLLKRLPTDSARKGLRAILKHKRGMNAKIGFSLVHFFTISDGDANGRKIAEGLIQDLPEPENYVLAVKLFMSNLLEMRESLIERFPFLGMKEAPEKARQWFESHSVARWPITASMDFTRELVVFLREGSHEKLKLGDMENMGTKARMFVRNYRELFEPPDASRTRRPLGAPTKKKVPRGNQNKVFTRIGPLDGVSLNPSAAPELRRGEVVDSPALLCSFFTHSTTTISQTLFDQIYANYPHLRDAARAYAGRVGLEVEPLPSEFDVQALMSTFSVKAKYLSRLCRTAQSGAQIEILRMLLFQQISALTSPKKWFYFLRFLRLSIVVDQKKAETYRRNTGERVRDIMTAFKFESDAVIAELCRLLESTFPVELIHQKTDQYPLISPVLYRQFQEADYFTEVPSVILDILSHCSQYPKASVVKLLEERRPLILSNCVLAQEVIWFLSENLSYVSKPEGYLPALLDPSSGLFVPAAPFTERLFEQCLGALGGLDQALTRIRIDGYAAASATSISSAYYRARAKASVAGDSAELLQTQEFLQLIEIFLLNPTASICRELSRILEAAARFLDAVGILIGRLLQSPGRFVWTVVLASSFYERAAKEQQSHIRQRVDEVPNLTPKSRKLALTRVFGGHKDEAFAIALAETDDDEILGRITDRFRSSRVP